MNKICFIICGQTRTIDLVIDNINNLFKNYEITYYLCISININNNEYINNFEYDLFKYNTFIKKILFIKSDFDNKYRNSLNYSKKIYEALNIIDDEYDLYFILRTDLIINSIDFINNINNTNNKLIYFSSKKNNQYIMDINDKINSDIIISRDLKQLIKLKEIHEKLLIENNYLDIKLYQYFNQENIEYKLINIEYKLVLSKCNIIAISGDSGSGKSTLLNYLTPLFEKNNYIKLETDRYHKWERGNPNYNIYTHLNPESNYLEKMSEDIYKLKIGEDIYTVDYNHNTGKFTQEEKIDSKNNVLLCGLHTLYNEQTNKLINLKIYMDTDRELIKKWKINRDVNERGYSIEKVLKQIEFRESDYKKYIEEQKKNSDLIIRFYEIDNKINCDLILINLNIKFIKELLSKQYIINIDNNNQINIKLCFNENSSYYFEEIYKIVKIIILNN
jgi:uridine kinase